MSGLLSASHRLLTLDHFGVPYDLSESPAMPGVEWCRERSDRPALLWPTAPGGEQRPVMAWLAPDQGDTIPIFARLTAEPETRDMMARLGGRWEPVVPINNRDGASLGSTWRSTEGDVLLPFDPDEVYRNYISEQYRDVLRPARGTNPRRLAMLGYYRVRGLLPRGLQIALRRRYARVQARAEFPRWPIETGLHDFLDLVLGLVQTVTSEAVPTIAPWPGGKTWALVLTHDVETAAGLAAIDPVCRLEQALGLRSAWNFVPRRYPVPLERLRALRADGFEIGVHGLYHDGRDLESPAMLRARLPGMREAADGWGAVGFRSPATHRRWDLMPQLGFDYDSSCPDTDPFEPQGGGCCSWLPFFNQELVELPLTMAQDHTLFVILRRTGDSTWTQKAELLRSRGGMALLDTHPDYLVSPDVFDGYRSFLERFSTAQDAWMALPSEVSAWWRRRSQSRLERTADGWQVRGPAAEEARVQMMGTDQPAMVAA